MRLFGHVRPVRDKDGGIIGQLASPVRAVTRGGLGHSYSSRERGRQLVVSLEAGDVVTFRQHKTRHTVSATAFDIYAWILRSQAMKANMARWREKKERKATRLASARQERTEKRLFKRTEAA